METPSHLENGSPGATARAMKVSISEAASYVILELAELGDCKEADNTRYPLRIWQASRNGGYSVWRLCGETYL